MKRMISTLVVITLVLLLSQPTWAAGNDSTQKERLKKAREANKETEIRSTVTVDVGKLDISGIRLGMTPDEVRAAIEKAYPNSKIDIRETSARHRSYTGKTLDCTSEGIRIKVSFALEPYGKGVFWVKFHSDLPDVEVSFFRDKLVSKYGKPNLLNERGIGMIAVWGDAKSKALEATVSPQVLILELTDQGPAKAYADKESATAKEKIKF